MSTTAVTPDSAPDFREFAEEQNRKDIARFRQENPEPEAKPQQEVQEKTETPAVQEESATSSETAAASETAPPQEKKGRTQATSENRWAKLSRENRELKERLAALESAQESPREVKQESQPAAETKPKAEKNAKPTVHDVDEKGQPKFKTYDEFLEARDAWLRADTLREFEERQTKTQKELQQKQQQETIAREWGSRVSKAKEKYADYDSVALNPELPIKQGSVVDAFILDSANGTDVLYHLGKNPQELERINGMNPLQQARELFKIEMKYSNPPVKRVTSAPPPPRTVNPTGHASADEVEQALKQDDFLSYRNSANARDIARFRGR